MQRAAAVLTFALLVAGCAAEPVAETAPALPPIMQSEAQFNPDPVELSSDISASEGGILISGVTNLPDGANLYYALTLFGSKCLTSNCRKLDYRSDGVESELARGYLTVLSGQFTAELPEWPSVPVCGWRKEGDWETSLIILFRPNERADGASPEHPGQPRVVYDLYGRAGERVEAAPGVELGIGGVGSFVWIEVMC
jgi:hypothetical protein